MDTRSVPRNTIEALALIYCKKHITENMSAKELAEMYLKVCEDLDNTFRANHGKNNYVSIN